MSLETDLFCRTLVQETSDAIVYADAQGRIGFWNKGAERMFGISAVEALGQSLDNIIPPNLRQRHWDGYEKTMQTGKSRYESGAMLAVPALRNDGNRSNSPSCRSMARTGACWACRHDAGRHQAVRGDESLAQGGGWELGLSD